MRSIRLFAGTLVTGRALLVVLFLCGALSAQYERVTAPFPVSVEGSGLAWPFFGGLNDPKPSLVDIDNDGLVDLLIGTPSGNLIFVQNTGTVNAPEWTPVSQRLAGVDVGSWHTFCDIDNDGDLDLFCDSRTARVHFYRNESMTGSFVFSLEDTAYGGFTAGNNVTPAFVDIDSDEDFDYFYGSTSGFLDFHENIGDPESASFVFVTNAYDSIYAFPGGGKSNAEERHGFSNITFADIDADSDADLFWGDIFNTNLYLFANLGDPSSSDLTWQTETYLPSATSGFNHPRFADLDNDSDLDMVVGVANNSTIDNLLYYRNDGLPILAQFNLQTQNLIECIDLGSSSFPAAVDIDDDGDIDLMVGNVSGQVALYENTGTIFQPEFTFVTGNFQGIDVGTSSMPEIVDWDSDGDYDLLIGTQLGRIQYWRNDGTPSSPSFVLQTDQLAGIKVDQLAVPRAADLNDDGLLDLVVGEWDFNSFANIRLYENTGISGAPELTLSSSSLLKRVLREFTIPTLFDWDNDGRIDIILGGRTSELVLYKNESDSGVFPDSLAMVPQPDSMVGVGSGYRLNLAFADIDSDADIDVFVGQESGGLSYYTIPGGCCQGMRGNIDNSPDGMIDIADLVYLVNYMFGDPAGSAPECSEEADINGDTIQDISDLVGLVAYAFDGGLPPLDCH